MRALAAAALGALVLVAGSVARAESEGARAQVLDRSFSCVVKSQAGARRITPSANSGFRDPRTSRWKWPAYAGVGGRALVAYAFVTAGGPVPTSDSGALVFPKAIGVDAAACNRGAARIPFTRRGLSGGLAGQLQGADTYECAAPARLLVRTRATFAVPTRVVQDRFFTRRWYTTADAAPARRAELAVAAASGKPLVYADVRENGKAFLFISTNCRED